MPAKTKLNFFPYTVGQTSYAKLEEIPTTFSSNTLVTQNSIDDDNAFLSRITIMRQLGEGGAGVAYLVNFQFFDNSTKQCVVKIPVNSQHILDQNHKFIQTTVQDHNVAEDQQVNFEWERNQILAIFFPYIKNHPSKFNQQTYALNPQTASNEIAALQSEIRALKQHPGHPYLHEFWHAKSSCLMLISEPCDGDVHDFAERNPSSINARFLLQFQLQTGLALEYIQRYVGKYHIDFKPANVFYKHTSSGSFHFKLSDFAELYSLWTNTTNSHPISQTKQFSWRLQTTPSYGLHWDNQHGTNIQTLISTHNFINAKQIMTIAWGLSFAELYMKCLGTYYDNVISGVKQNWSLFSRLQPLFPTIYNFILVLLTAKPDIYLSQQDTKSFEAILNDLIRIYNQNTSPATTLQWHAA